MIFRCDICCNSVIIILRLRWLNWLVFMTMGPALRSKKNGTHRQTIKLINGTKYGRLYRILWKFGPKNFFVALFLLLLLLLFLLGPLNHFNEELMKRESHLTAVECIWLRKFESEKDVSLADRHFFSPSLSFTFDCYSLPLLLFLTFFLLLVCSLTLASIS